ncbi:MAG: hypothetical protein JWM78_1757 [Verrucomicrobiaceae bacterium]|nr:hypothetical protein [Verrucomicrobiaceae bacterium]
MKLSNTSLRCACMVALLAVAPSLLAAQQGYYRWKDDAGAEHFTQQPPAGRKSEFIAVSTGRSTEVAPGETADTAAPAKEAAKSGEKPIGPIQGVPDKDPEKCKQAHESQAVLNSHARIREKVGDDYRYLTPDEIGEQKKLAQESTDVYCEGSPAK